MSRYKQVNLSFDVPAGVGIDADHEVSKYGLKMADTLGLSDWSFSFGLLPVSSDSAGENHSVYGRKHAYIAIREDYSDLGPEWLAETMIHELLHCHLTPLDHAIESAVELMSAETQRLIHGIFRQNLEFAVDGIAVSIAPLTTMPKIKKARRREPVRAD